MTTNDPSNPGHPAPTPDWSAATQQAQGYATQIGTLTSSINNLSGTIGNLISRFMGANAAQKEGVGTMNDYGGAVNIATTEVLNASRAFDGFTSHISEVRTFTDQMNELGYATKFSTDLIGNLASKMGVMPGALTTALGAVKQLGEKFISGADSALKLQTEYLHMMGATGGLGRVYEEAGTHLVDLNDALQKQRTLIDDLADATGQSSAQIAQEYAAMGSAISGSTEKQITVNEATGESMNNLQAAITVASGTGRDFKDVLTDLSTAFDTYGLEGEKALEFTTRMSDLSQKFGINLQYTRDYLTKTADAFAVIAGTNGTDAENTFNRMFQSLRDTGLSAKQSSNIISDMTSSVSRLTLAQKAFLSAQSGGPGGLRGAYHIENLLREGKTDEVVKMMEQSLRKQFGGKIYTQKEAETSDYAAAQFTRQRMLLQSGAFGGLVKDDATATRVLEAMRNGTSATQALQSGQDSVATAVEHGQDVQERSYSVLTRILNAIERERGVESIGNLDTIQKMVGTTVRTDRGENARLAADTLNVQRRSDLVSKAAGTTAMVARHEENEKVNVNDERAYSLKSSLDALKAVLPESLKNTFASAEEKMLSKSPAEQSIGNQQYQDTLNQLANVQNAQNNMITQIQQQVSTGRALGIGAAAANAAAVGTITPMQAAPGGTHTNTNKTVPGGTAAQSPTTKVDIKVHGVVCANCAKPVDPHIQAVTSNTF